MRELPRQLTHGELAELFEGETQLVELLAGREDPLDVALDVARQELGEDEQVEALNAHPAIGARRLSPRAKAEQGGRTDPATLIELSYLNRVYEEKFGFRFVVFVNRRPKAEILEVLRDRIGCTREEELEAGLTELVAIARDRWERG